MFDRFEPFKRFEKQGFSFQPSRFETWKKGNVIDSGTKDIEIIANVIHKNVEAKVQVEFGDTGLHNELAPLIIYDEFITSTDRLQLVTNPQAPNSGNVAITMFKMTVGATRESKDFTSNEPYCCNLFMKEGVIAKITFSFSKPEKLIEFYQ